jgi:prophage antirepressor-like protein
MPDKNSTSSLLPLHYDGHQVRTFMDDHGFVWWVAQDVGAILSIENVRQNLHDFPPNEIRVCTTYTPCGQQKMLTVNEPGLYRLLFQSRKPEAEALKLWVFHDVLPTLRRTGTYTIPHAPDQLTPQGQLPPPAPRVREHAEVSWHLAAVWSLFHRTGECLTNHEIAQRTGIAPRTARAHTRYLLQVGMLEVHETFPRHLYVLSPQAATRHIGVYQRLQVLTAVIEERQRL